MFRSHEQLGLVVASDDADGHLGRHPALHMISMADHRATAQEASQAVASCVRAAARALEHADSAEALVSVLQALLDLLVRANADEAARRSAIERLLSSEGQSLQQALQHVGWDAVHASFAAQPAEALATIILQEVASTCTSDDSAQDLLLGLVGELFAAWSAPVALAALVGHLSLLEPSSGRGPKQRRSKQPISDLVVVDVPGSDLAAILLAERFGADNSNGVQQLVAYFAEQQQQAGKRSAGNGQHHSGASSSSSSRTWDADEAAGQLASVPDRVAHLPNMPRELAGPHFARHVLSEALAALQQAQGVQQQQPLPMEDSAVAAGPDAERMLSHQTASTSAASSTAAAAILDTDWGTESSDMGFSVPGSAFVAVLLQRLIARGHGATAAGTLLDMLTDGRNAAGAGTGRSREGVSGILPSVLEQLARSHQAATEKLLTELLLQLSSTCTSSPGASVRVLHTLLPPALLQPGSPARYLLCEKLLLRRTLPTRALQLLLSFLDTTQPSLLPGVAFTLAQAWAEAQGVLHTKLPQQAYMAQALQGCLTLLPKAALEVGSSALLGAVLQGVSARLGSPLPAVRHQGMRVGRALSVRLDPSKPLFDDQGDLGLLREELWPGAAATAATGAAGSTTVAASTVAAAGAPMGATSAEEGQVPGTPQQAKDSSGSGGDAGSSSSSEEGRVSSPASGRLSATLQRLEEATALPDSDDEDVSSEDDDDDDDDSIRGYDLHEDLEAESWEAAHWQSAKAPAAAAGGAVKPVVALRPLAAALRKADDVNVVLDALKRVEVLVRANPEELLTFAPELARSLLHCRAPDWAEAEAGSPADAPEAQRSRALTALLAMAPLEAGDQVLEEVYSPHLDMYQRLLIMDSLCAAARELADPRTAPQLELGQAAPQLVPPGRSLQALKASSATGVAGAAGRGAQDAAAAGHQQDASRALEPGDMRQGRTRVWGNVALRKLKEGDAAGPRTFRNRFTGVAVRWASALLRECDVRRHGVDLFGRDGLLLGRLLTTLGTFAECVAQTHTAIPLAAGTLELVRAPQVSASEQPFVRRSALLAAAQVVSSLPPARLAGALVGQGADAQNAVLVERLQWLQTWASGAAAGDADENCRLLAAAVVGMQAELASASMAALQTLPPPAEHGLQLTGGGSGRGRGGISIEVPRISQLQVG